MKVLPTSLILLTILSLFLSGCDTHAEAQPEHIHHKVVVTSPMAKDVVITEDYVCQIHSMRHIEVRALVSGYLEQILVKEGQAVKTGDPMFKILPILYQAELDAKLAEVQSAQVELEQSKNLLRDRVVSQVDVTLHAAKLANAQAEAKRAEAELNFTNIKAPFDGIVDRLQEQLGSLVEEKDVLTTLSDNSVMWVYFNVPEARYLEYMASLASDRTGDQVKEGSVQNGQVGDEDEVEDEDIDEDDQDVGGRVQGSHSVSEPRREQSQDITLVLADGSTFPHTGKITAIEAQFNNETGNIPFRADFPNPERLLRHGQTGNVLIRLTLKNVLVIPQRATFEILDKQYVYVIGEDDVVHQREIKIQHELEDTFVIQSGLNAHDKFVLDGVQQVHDGETVEYESLTPEESLANQKHHAE